MTTPPVSLSVATSLGTLNLSTADLAGESSPLAKLILSILRPHVRVESFGAPLVDRAPYGEPDHAVGAVVIVAGILFAALAVYGAISLARK